MRVLHLLASTDRRGAEVFGTDLARALDDRGHSNEVVALTRGATGGLDVEVVGALGSWRDARALRSRARSADVVLAHGSRGLVAGSLATAGTSTPLVYRSIGDPAYWGSSWARRLRIGWQLRRAAAVTALWPEAAQVLVDRYRLQPERVAVAPNAADPRRFTPIDADERRRARDQLDLDPGVPVAAYIGALSVEKRLEVVVESVAASAGLHLLVAGDGPQWPAVAEAAGRHLGERAHLLGSVADVRPIYAAADVVVLLSATEGQPGVAIEAGLRGLPVVATAVGGVPSVVVDGATGVLVRGDAAPGDIATAIDAALERSGELGPAARARCLDHFTFDVVADTFEQVLAEANG